ncbi:unnamed protein product [Rhodiola kirilowii]
MRQRISVIQLQLQLLVVGCYLVIPAQFLQGGIPFGALSYGRLSNCHLGTSTIY